MQQLGFRWTDFREIWYLNIFRKFFEKIQVLLKSDKNTGHCTVTEVFLNLTEVFLTLTEVFPCLFLSYKANARVKLAKMGHGPHSSTLVDICVVRVLFVFVLCIVYV
jgi:hypothetical protein